MKQKKLLLSFKLPKLMILFLLLSTSKYLFSHNIIYDKFDYSKPIHRILNDNQSEIYKIQIENVAQFLPYDLSIQKDSVKLLDERLLPLKAMVKIMYWGFHKKKNKASLNSHSFFSNLSENTPYTYVIKDSQFIATHSTHLSKTEKWRDRFSKHYFISGLKNNVRYAGEFYVVKSKKNNQIAVVLNNASGTFCPNSSYLPALKALMESNFYQENLYFMVKKHDEKFDIGEILDSFELSIQQLL